jgi:hypothetical protein
MERMAAPAEDPIAAWKSIVGLIHAHIEGRTGVDLDRRDDGESMTRREVVHHVVEANVVAASIVIAALGSPGCAFDWSWMLPFGPWLERMRYADKPIGPALKLCEALNEYVVNLVSPPPGGLQRAVLLVDQPGAEPRRTTVGRVLLQEAEHAREHLAS